MLVKRVQDSNYLLIFHSEPQIRLRYVSFSQVFLFTDLLNHCLEEDVSLSLVTRRRNDRLQAFARVHISLWASLGQDSAILALEECLDTSLDGTVSIFCSPEPPRLDQQGLF